MLHINSANRGFEVVGVLFDGVILWPLNEIPDISIEACERVVTSDISSYSTVSNVILIKLKQRTSITLLSTASFLRVFN